MTMIARTRIARAIKPNTIERIRIDLSISDERAPCSSTAHASTSSPILSMASRVLSNSVSRTLSSTSPLRSILLTDSYPVSKSETNEGKVAPSSEKALRFSFEAAMDSALCTPSYAC